MKTPRRFIALLGLAAVVAALVGCGSTAKREVPANAIAVVGSQPILRSQYDELLAQVKRQYAQSKKSFPAVGSTGYESIRSRIVAYLVQIAAVEQEATKMGISVPDAEVNAQLKSLIVQKFGGKQSKYRAELLKEGVTERQVKDGIRQNLISQRVQSDLTQNVKVSQSDIKSYYDSHKSSYKKAESRKASHILVKSKTLADSIYAQLKAGANFAKLAKKYTKDTGSKSSGGSLGTVEKGTMVAPFQKALFALKTGTFSKPVKSSYGWHIILAVGPVKPSHLESLKEASPSIEQTLLQQAQSKAVTDWVQAANKWSASHTTYASGFAPAKTTSSTVATTTTATTS